MPRNSKVSFYKRYRALTLATILAGGGTLQLASSLLAQPATGTISNTATATYQDPNDPNNTFTAVSNTVTVKIAEVAGITVVAATPNDQNGGNVTTGDTLDFVFTVTNVGNDTTNIFIPGRNQIAPATSGLKTDTTLVVKADLDNDGTYETTIPAGGFTTTTPIAPNAQIKIQVTGDVSATTVGAPISVSLGNTGATPNQQNIPYSADGTDGNQLRTVNVADGVSGEIEGAPINGVREAAASTSINLGAAIAPQRAFSTVLLTRTGEDPGAAANLQDDQITYRLDLRVENQSPDPLKFSPGALEGKTITLNGVSEQRILVSNALPVGTKLVPGSVAAPAGWTAVYSETPTTSNALTATWSTTAPTTQAAADAITRIGFIYTGTSSNLTLPAGTSTETDVDGFRFTVVTKSVASGATTATINSIGQVFGETVGDTSNGTVYDESGDQNPNNFDGINPSTGDTNGYGGFNSTNDLGIAAPAQGIDGANNNTGTGDRGEINQIIISTFSGILNGTLNQPAAIGPSNNNDDFTNRSAKMDTAIAPSTTPGTPATLNPDVVTFTNTFQNPASSGTTINVRLLPLAPSDPGVPSASQQPNNNIQDGSTVKITVDPDGAGPLPSQTATYTYTNGTYTRTAGSNIILTNVAPGTTINYTVEVDLAAGTPLSADLVGVRPAGQEGFPVPIAAFVDNNGNGLFDTSTDPYNVTIDRVYTGFVKLVKSRQLLPGTGPAIVGDTVASGNIVKYTVAYQNFSTQAPAGGSGNVVLSASNLKIIEDGTVDPDGAGGIGQNSWALPAGSPITFHEKGTTADLGTVTYFNSGTTLGTSDPDSGDPVSKYENNIPSLAPGTNGVFTFQRKLR
jgi:hypothetical protein